MKYKIKGKTLIGSFLYNGKIVPIKVETDDYDKLQLINAAKIAIKQYKGEISQDIDTFITNGDIIQYRNSKNPVFKVGRWEDGNRY